MTPLLALALLAGCDLSMQHQKRGEAQGSPTLWQGGPARQPMPPGTVAQDQIAAETVLSTPPPLTPALLDRGQEQYGIFCAVCHGERGDGDGVVVRHGFPAPPSYQDPRLMAAAPSYVVDVITHGHGIMYAYADRVAPADRWAIAAYVKALQAVQKDGS